MWVQQRNIMKLSGLIQMNSKTSLNLGDFHDFMHFFSDCGKFVSNSGFEEILYQARMCSVGGIKPVLSGKSLQHVFENSLRNCRNNIYVTPLISVILV